jgi:hypothetical protein
MSLLCADVGPVHLAGFSRTRRHPRLEVGAVGATGPAGVVRGPLAGEAERVLRWVERNLTTLTRAVPMVEIKDLPPFMQPHVFGVP